MFPELQVLDRFNKDGEEVYSDYGDEDDEADLEEFGKGFIDDPYGDEDGFEGGEDDMDDFEGAESESENDGKFAAKRPKH